jgi:hypothetical protein
MSAVTLATRRKRTVRIKDVYFPNGGLLYHQRNAERRDGGSCNRGARRHARGRRLFGDRTGMGRTFRQVPWPVAVDGRREIRQGDHERRHFAIVSVYAQANLLQIMQCTACNALHNVTQRVLPVAVADARSRRRRHLLAQTGISAVMLGVHRPTVTVVLRTLQREGLIASRYGRISILKRKRLEAASCECYSVIRDHFARLGL